jgi:hypothetical protein
MLHLSGTPYISVAMISLSWIQGAEKHPPLAFSRTVPFRILTGNLLRNKARTVWRTDVSRQTGDNPVKDLLSVWRPIADGDERWTVNMSPVSVHVNSTWLPAAGAAAMESNQFLLVHRRSSPMPRAPSTARLCPIYRCCAAFWIAGVSTRPKGIAWIVTSPLLLVSDDTYPSRTKFGKILHCRICDEKLISNIRLRDSHMNSCFDRLRRSENGEDVQFDEMMPGRVALEWREKHEYILS